MADPSRYVEIALGAPNNRGSAIPVGELGDWVTKAQVNGMPLYRSYYSFDAELIDHLRVFKTIRTFKGKRYLDQIIFDIDKGKDADAYVLERVRAFITRLTEDWLAEEHIHTWFSGSGYHVTIPDIFQFEPTENLPLIVRATLTSHFPEGDDIYDHARIIRMGQTPNQKTGAYKIPLATQEVFNLTAVQIIALAKQGPRRDFEYPAPTFGVEDAKYHDRIIAPRQRLTFSDENTPRVSAHTRDDPTRIVTCAQKMYNEGDGEGTRHQKIRAMTSIYRRSGLTLDAAIAMMTNWASTMDAYEVKRIVSDGYEKGYRYGCDNDFLKKYCDSKCVYFQRKDYAPEVVTASGAEKEFNRFVTTDFTRTSFDLNEIFEISGSYRFFPGEFVLVIGDTKLGKSALMQHICVRLPRMRVLYLSLEVAQNLTFRRFIQTAHNMTKPEVIEFYRKNVDGLSDAISHIQIMTVAPELKAIRSIIADVDPQIVVVDTTDCIDVKFVKDSLQKDEALGRGLKEIAQQMNVIIFGVHHISKASTRETLNIHSGKGGSTFEQKADKVIGIEGNMATPSRIIRALGSRDETGFRLATVFNYETMTFQQVLGATV